MSTASEKRQKQFKEFDSQQLENTTQSETNINALNDIKEELQRRTNETPTHDELMEVYEGAKEKDQLEIGKLLAKRFFEKRESLSLVGAKKTEDGAKIELEINSNNEPTLTYKQIKTKEVKSRFFGIFRKEEEEKVSDEVLVAINLNNGEDSEEDTVVVMWLKQKLGKLDTDILDGGSLKGGMKVMSKSEFDLYQDTDAKQGKSNTPTARALRGELTFTDYKKAYVEHNKQTLAEYHEKRDAELRNNPDHWESNAKKAELITKIETDYTELLQSTTARIEQIQLERNEKVQETRRKKAETNALINSDEFLRLLKITDWKQKEAYLKFVANYYNKHPNEIRDLLREKRT